MENDKNQIKQYAIDTFEAEAAAVRNLSNLLTDDFAKAVEAILKCTGKVVVTGMGKSGIIGKKIAATLASTGTPSFFLHPGEAYHGDLGMISSNDIVLAIANSGQTDEILRLIPFMQNNGNTIIAMTGNPESTLAKNAHLNLNIAVEREACPLNLAPTSSTTAMLVMGDALAIALMKVRGFRAEDYAVFHPGGSLGRRLLTRVKDVMRKDALCVPKTMTLGDVIIAISDARLGIAAVVEDGKLIGATGLYCGYLDFIAWDLPAVLTAAQAFFEESGLPYAHFHAFRRDVGGVPTRDLVSIIVTDDNSAVVGVVEFFNVSVLG